MTKTKKKILILLLVLILLPAGLLMLAVQPFFIKGVILPRVEQATDSSIEVESLRLSPLRKLSLDGLVFRLNDGSFEATVKHLHVQYDLLQILKGNIDIGELTLEAPVVQVTAPPSTTNTEPPSEDSAPSAAEPPQLNIRNVTLKDGAFRFKQPEGEVRLSDIQFALPAWIRGKEQHPLHPEISFTVESFTAADPEVAQITGRLEADMELRLSDRFLPTHLNGKLSARLQETGTAAPPLDIQADVDIASDVAGKKITASALSLQVLQDGKDLAALTLTQATEINLSTSPPEFSDTEISLQIPPVNLPTLPFAEFLPVKSGRGFAKGHVRISNSGKEMQSAFEFGLADLTLQTEGQPDPVRVGVLQGDADLSWTSGKDVVFSVHLNSREVKIRPEKPLPSPLQLTVRGNGNSGAAVLEEVRLAWKESEAFKNELSIIGRADWSRPEALTADLRVEAESLDLNPWADWITPGDADPAPAPSATGSSVADPVALQLPRLPLETATLRMQAGQIRYNNTTLRDLKLDLQAGERRVDLRPLSVTVNGSTLKAEGTADWADRLTVSMNSSLSAMDLAPVVDTLLPEKEGAVRGTLQFQTDLRATGHTPPELWDSFAGKVQVSYTDGKIRLLDENPEQHRALLHTREVVREIVTALADVLQLKPEQLMAPDIESVHINTTVQDQNLILDRFEVLNPEFLLRAKGRVLLQPEVGASQIQDLPVVLGLNTNLAKRVKIYRENRVQDSYVVLPSFITVSGTLAHAELEVKKGVITGLILSGVTERNQVGNENVQTGLEILGSLLSGEPVPVKTPVPEPTPVPGVPPTPTPKPGKTERILEGIQLFNQLRATPTPVPER